MCAIGFALRKINVCAGSSVGGMACARVCRGAGSHAKLNPKKFDDFFLNLKQRLLIQDSRPSTLYPRPLVIFSIHPHPFPSMHMHLNA
eukprot:COSAG02_NODE_898_length_16108_cov_5.877444_19_plen_88_part_00